MSSRYIALFMAFVSVAAMAEPPHLYHEPAHESPVRGEPDDLLLIAGSGLDPRDLIVYRAIGDAHALDHPPLRIPDHSGEESGMISIVSAAAAPNALTVRLPSTMRKGQAYSLWVRAPSGEWSLPIAINDARPQWLSPAYVYASSSPGSSRRELKIVGRNLQPSAGHVTQVRLIGPQSVIKDTLAHPRAAPDTDAGASSEADNIIEEYAARIALPPHLIPGRYRVLLNRDGLRWVELPGQLLEVLPDKPSLHEFQLADARFGGCRPDDGMDDTGCIVRAIAAADQSGGGVVVIGAGSWDLIDSSQPGVDPHEGIVVPGGVQLRGAGSGSTILKRHRQWNEREAPAAFTLLGPTIVSGLTFRDLQVYQPTDRAGPVLQLGEDWQRAAALGRVRSTPHASNIVITENVFDKPMVAISSGGLPIDRLFITFNTFGAYNSALELTGDPFNMAQKFHLDDSVIDYNVFKPGSELDLQRKIGPIASELGGGHRVDFSNNSADGTSTEYLYDVNDPKGWRAAFFWSPNDNIEQVLVSENRASCTGDKIGDGEAFAFDNNLNTFALQDAATVMTSSADGVTVATSMAAKQNNRDVPPDYYIGHWVQLVSGPGLGQARKIVGYSTDPRTGRTRLEVEPRWDVIPVPARTRIAIGREYWQLLVVANQVDNRMPLCEKSNRSRRAGGVIEIWGQSVDTVLAGNHQYHSDGIFVQQNVGFVRATVDSIDKPCADCTLMGFFNYFFDIRENVIDGEYDWANNCSQSGIGLGVAAAPGAGGGTPPTVSFGGSVSHNKIRHADAQFGGAIAIVNTWFSGPEPHRWPLSDDLLVQHNAISDVDGPRALAACGASHPRLGIAFPEPAIAWRTVLYANTCKDVSIPLGPGGIETVKVCPSPVPDSCECR